MDYEVNKTFLFDWKKWILIFLCSTNIILMIVYASICSILAERYLYDFETFEAYRIEDAKMLVIIVLVMISIFSISFSILGIIGAVRESFTMTLVFAVLSLLNLAATIGNSIKRPYYIPCAIWAILTTISATILAYDLHIINRRKKSSNCLGYYRDYD